MTSFFGGPLPEYAGPTGFTEHEDCVQGLDGPSLALIKPLDLVIKLREGEESVVVDFAAELLRAVGYEGESYTYAVKLCMQRQTSVSSPPGLKFYSSEDKTHISASDTGTQLIAIAEAIVAFQENNAKRVDDLFLPPLEIQVIPGMMMVVTFPKSKSPPVWIMPSDSGVTRTIAYRHTRCIPG